jgi:hypothetical protein
MKTAREAAQERKDAEAKAAAEKKRQQAEAAKRAPESSQN